MGGGLKCVCEMQQNNKIGSCQPKILSYKNSNVFEKKFKEDFKTVSVVFLTKKGYCWYNELVNCNSLFYKT